MHHLPHRGHCPRIPKATMSITPAPDTPWLVLKFGGTSVSKRERWDTIGRLAAERADAESARVLVVVSALSGVTNELLAISQGDISVLFTSPIAAVLLAIAAAALIVPVVMRARGRGKVRAQLAAAED